jgi:hypothetical protein
VLQLWNLTLHLVHTLLNVGRPAQGLLGTLWVSCRTVLLLLCWHRCWLHALVLLLWLLLQGALQGEALRNCPACVPAEQQLQHNACRGVIVAVASHHDVIKQSRMEDCTADRATTV